MPYYNQAEIFSTQSATGAGKTPSLGDQKLEIVGEQLTISKTSGFPFNITLILTKRDLILPVLELGMTQICSKLVMVVSPMPKKELTWLFGHL